MDGLGAPDQDAGVCWWRSFQQASHGKRARVLELSRRPKHRGPDWSGLRQVGNCYLSHQRLTIIDPASGDQPLYNEDQSVLGPTN
jgi:asparagine synthase (glutamine-hydrolysing)